jgi:hypothetical protein
LTTLYILAWVRLPCFCCSSFCIPSYWAWGAVLCMKFKTSEASLGEIYTTKLWYVIQNCFHHQL